MTPYQLYTRFRHAATARHWRGHGVHSPMMYRFVREVVLPVPRRAWTAAIVEQYGAEWQVVEIGSIAELPGVARSEAKTIALLREPFRSAAERREFDAWFGRTHVVAAHLQGLLVLFFDPKLQKQFFRIRN